MDYEQKYKEVLERAKEFYALCEKCGAKDTVDFLEGIFPELKENKDEKIIKRIIHALHGDVLDMEETTKAIFWLEKQGKNKGNNKLVWKHWSGCGIAGNGDGEPIYLIKTGNTYSLSSCLGFECDYIELSELDNLMLEKQGEQKVPVVDFKAEDWYVSKVDGKIHNIYNSVDKVEPKFHEGEWIVQGYNILKIKCVGDTYYCFETVGGYVDDMLISEIDSQFHLWTIKDAKNGDVLINKNYMGESPFIFKETKPSNIKTDVPNPLTVLGYCGIGGAGFTKSSGWGDTANCIYYPATKSQRGTLLKAMADARYTFDFEKKELKKISQRMVSAETKEALYDKPAWSEEDEKNLQGIIDEIQANKNNAPSYDIPVYEGFLNWLKSLRPQKQWKPSDEQMDALAWALSLAKNCGEENAFDLRTLYEQLKKLKRRMRYD